MATRDWELRVLPIHDLVLGSIFARIDYPVFHYDLPCNSGVYSIMIQTIAVLFNLFLFTYIFVNTQHIRYGQDNRESEIRIVEPSGQCVYN